MERLITQVRRLSVRKKRPEGMATSENTAKLGRYDYQFSKKVPKDWECVVCHLRMKDLVQIVECGHRFCKACLESLLRRSSPTCPADRQPLAREKIMLGAACRRKSLNLTVKCSFVGCTWIGDLQAMEKHQSQCSYKVVQCPNPGCSEKFAKQDMMTHVTSECSWRKINCEYCREPLIKDQKQEHFYICEKFPVHCTNECGLTDIPREKLEIHIRDECPETEVCCDYKNLGCEAMFPRSNTKSHLESQVEFHLNLALRGLEATRHRVHALVGMARDQSKKIERLEKGVSKVNDQSQRAGRLKKTTEYTLFVWKIANFQAVYERAYTREREIILSEPFYLTKNGYKFRIKMMPNGGETSDLTTNNHHRGRWLSLFIKVVPGEFDSSLSWPCREKVRLTLIDQNPCQDNKKNISTVIDLSKQECARPVTEGDEGFGCPDFVSQSIFRSGAYIKNNTIFVLASKV